MKIEVIPAKIEQKPIVSNLLELYSYDFTEFFDFDIGDNGFYGYEWLPLYWTEPNRFPYLIYVDDKLAGLVLIQKGSPISDDKELYDVAEFFIMRKYKGKKIGTSVAFKIWEMFKGHWQVRVLVENKIACSFWQNTIEKFTNKKVYGTETKIKNDLWLVYRFESR